MFLQILQERSQALTGFSSCLKLVVSILCIWLMFAPVVNAAESVDIDSQSGLIVDTGWQMVRAQCGACHSLRLVTQNRSDREGWLRLIRWMQETQKLWPIPPPVEDEILTYLAKHYAPSHQGRRPPLSASLLPPN